MPKEQSIFKINRICFWRKKMQTHYSVLIIYFYDYKLAREVEEKGHNDRDITMK